MIKFNRMANVRGENKSFGEKEKIQIQKDMLSQDILI